MENELKKRRIPRNSGTKKMLTLPAVIFALLVLFSVFLLAGCDEEATEKEISGVTFENVTATYDGEEKTITAANIPSGVNAIYTDNKGTDAGVYEASVTLSGEGYKTKTMNATLTINKADITGVALTQNEKVTVDTHNHKPTLTGAVPSGVSAKWYFNNILTDGGVSKVGTYSVSVVLEGKNYNPLTLTTTFKINENLTGLATKLINSFGNVPNTWSILPEKFKVDNYAIAENQIPDYTNFTNVSDIPTKYVGKQLNVVLGILNECDTALDYVNTVYGTLNVIETAYQAFLNTAPDNYEEFSDNTGAFTYKIVLDGSRYYLTAAVNDTVKVTLFSDADSETYGARVQLNAATVLKYTVTETGFKVALNVLDSSSTQVEFIRNAQNNNLVTGYIYEYLTVAGKEIVATSALLSVGETYTTVVGIKGDFIPTSDSRNCEVYRNSTGALVGTEVKEMLGDDSKTYDTLWYNLKDIEGITSIKMEDAANFLNPDTIYINGNSDSISSMIVSALPPDPSRRFDIEFKKVLAYVYDSENEEYKEIEFDIPMMFIQEKCIGTFESDFESKNDVSVTLNVSTDDKNAVDYGYKILVTAYDTIKNLVTQQSIIDYCTEDFSI